LDYKNAKIDDKQFWEIHKLLNNDEYNSMPKELEDQLQTSLVSKEEIIKKFGIGYKANYLTVKPDEREREVTDKIDHGLKKLKKVQGAIKNSRHISKELGDYLQILTS
jgi:hypothetical protein